MDASLSIQSTIHPNALPTLPSRYCVLFESKEFESHQKKDVYDQKYPYQGLLLDQQRLTAEDWEQDVRHYVVQLDSSMKFDEGDSLAILPQNPEKEVLALLRRIQLSPDTVISQLVPQRKDYGGPKSLSHLPFPMTLFQLFRDFLDITGVARAYFFELLSHFASAEHEMERLIYFSTAEAQDEVRRYCQKERKTVYEILEDFPSAMPPLEYVLDLIPPTQPRLFSIASSQKLKPDRAELLVAAVVTKTPLGKIKKGLCTQWLTGLTPSQDRLRIWIKKGSPGFCLPPDPQTPFIMIGPGTGLAPFRSFIQERVAKHRSGVALGKILLFTGCRHQTKDWCFGKELQGYVDEGVLTQYCVAFSRDEQETKGHRTYVQHLLLEQSKQIWTILQAGGVIFLSGSSQNMPKNVKESLCQIIQQEGHMEQLVAEDFFRQLELSGRFRTETWQ